MVGSFNSFLANHYFNLQEDIFSSWGLSFTKAILFIFQKNKIPGWLFYFKSSPKEKKGNFNIQIMTGRGAPFFPLLLTKRSR
jgi:hypothetical protein